MDRIERVKEVAADGLGRFVIGQLPWVISVLFGFGYVYSRVESKLETISIQLIELRAAQKDFISRGELRLLREKADETHKSFDRRLDWLERQFGRTTGGNP